MDLLQALEQHIVLDYLAPLHEGPHRHMELDAPANCLLVLSEDLVHYQLDLA